jgi:hypothetical protein
MRRPTPEAIDKQFGDLLNRYQSQASTQPTEPENQTDKQVSTVKISQGIESTGKNKVQYNASSRQEN